MVDILKRAAWRKPDRIIFHSDTKDLENNVNTMKNLEYF